MNRKIAKRFATYLHLAAILLTLSVFARADGSLAFLLAPSTPPTTVEAGAAFSWMEVARDWDGVQKQTVVVGGNNVDFAVPTVNYVRPNFEPLKVTTSRTASNLVMRFQIPDVTHKQPGGATLQKGDQIIIQIDPNNSGHTGGSTSLSVGTPCNIATDYRFEIVIKDDLVDSSGFKVPDTTTSWGVLNQPSPGCAAPSVSSFTATPSGATAGYDVTLNIPLAFVGSPNGPVGIAFAYLNDIGHGHPAGGGTTWEMLGTAFPSSMTLSTVANDPGLGLTAANTTISGSWLNPSQWGTGFFSPTAGDVTFTHTPVFWFSNSIKLGLCTTTNWNQIDAAPDGNQSGLANWYKYHPGATATDLPCQMRVWLQVKKTPAAGTVKRRFLIVWATPGIAPGTWSVVSLIDPIGVTNNNETFSVLWPNVPKSSFSLTSHPCIRAYVLPELLDQTANDGGTTVNIDKAFIESITTQHQLDLIEAAYNVNAGADAHTAQMNFTNIVTNPMNCPDTKCQQTASLDGGGNRPADASTGEGVRILKASFNPAADNNATAAQQTNDTGGETQDVRGGLVRIYVEGFGVDVGGTSKDYTFLQTLGGIGYVITNKDLVANQGLTLQFEVTNPRLLRRDLTRNPPTEVLSPTRDVFLNVKVLTTNGVTAPTFTVNVDHTHLGPGETSKGTIVVKPGGNSGGGPKPPDVGDFKHWGLSLHAGASIPHGNFSNFTHIGPNVGVDLEYRFNPVFSLEGIYTYHRFSGDKITIPVFGTFHFPPLNLHQLSVNGKIYGGAPAASVRPFINFGGGAYVFNSGSVHGGLNIGGGLQFTVTPNFAVDTMYNFNNVFTSGVGLRFSTLQGGVRFRF
jgi:hypothetical protein